MTSTTASPQSGTELSAKLVYLFGDGRAEGGADMRNLLGGKGAGLSEMSSLGIPVPPGLTITTEVCSAYYANGRRYPDGLDEQVRAGMAHVESIVGARFGDAANPLLVSVRSGARVSMPGMMDTVLNLGLNDETVQGLARSSGDERFAYDSYRRFVAMYGDVVLGLKRESDLDEDPFEAILERKKEACGVSEDTDLPAAALREIVAESKAEIRAKLGIEFPDDPWEQLWAAIGAVFESWESDRAIVYRQLNGYPGEWGTAVNVQAMVFGNLGDDCATGVAFTRNPKNGATGLFGEYLVNAQGEDVVAGVRTPQPIRLAERIDDGPPSMEEAQPAVYGELLAAAQRLEDHFRDMQDIEFTVQRGKLWVLQTRNGKRTGPAMVKVAVDLVDQGLIDHDEALRRQDPEQISELLHSVFADGASTDVIATGLPASPGAAVGKVVFSAEEAAEQAEAGEDVILVRVETSPEDIQGMLAAQGILTARGGMTSHAAVVARGWGKCCVAGCGELEIDYAAGSFRVDAGGRNLTIRRGDVISLNGTTGEVMLGAVPLADPELPDDLTRLMAWGDDARRLGVRANADTPEDAAKAREFGAEGIGLCRTEHMFFGEDRILAVRQMILAENEAGRRDALARILPMQRQDFEGILRAMAGFPVTIRLLDPPLHEFLPHGAEEMERFADAISVEPGRVSQRVLALQEFNPMLGHRGVRLAITYPEIYEVQTRAIIEAACDLRTEGVDAQPEIMIPLVGAAEELARLRERVEAVASQVTAERGVSLDYTIGTMIELPRACVVADQIAGHADFFSFGTNDLTQTTFGLSRDDAGRFLPDYISQNVLEKDPFVELDRDGVGELMRIGIERGRGVKPDLKLGICGEHGGDPASIAFGHDVGLDYVSCSPYRVLTARLAAAQAALAGRS
ncbi:MAG: pyruvate, phosphate dikinase [Dehalococcoidia bacterium]|nr:pyruvate, phosphate dikinase [Dehalococcoidia bacterium]MYD28473.1 pyruvate, phosphate dikinase [Dehalococcoidia bacterium]